MYCIVFRYLAITPLMKVIHWAKAFVNMTVSICPQCLIMYSVYTVFCVYTGYKVLADRPIGVCAPLL